MHPIEKRYDFIVVGGGMAGVCAAIAAARHGAETALIQDRPVLGGNASSEIRMHICGADVHGQRPNARETGIIEEILLENKCRNPEHSYAIFDTVLWEKCRFQPGLSLYLNTRMTDAVVRDDYITAVKAVQMTTEKEFIFSAPLFMDATGDGVLGAKAGAEYMYGREGKAQFGESFSPAEPDACTMGSSLLFYAKDMGHPVPFIKPFWANTYTERDLRYREHSDIRSGYWWIELGGGNYNTITDAETIRDELLQAVYGVWDHIKNGGDHGAENYELEWVGMLPGKRESRRFIGDYILSESDCYESRRFEDAVAYGGWPMDVHTVEGFLTGDCAPTTYLHMKEPYAIPYRCLYSKNIQNLFLGGRIISCTHMAFASTRVMGTCAVAAQAAGTAAAMALRYGLLPRELGGRIKELQQTLLRDDCYIPHIKNEDATDLARGAAVSASAQLPGFEASRILSGFSRPSGDISHCFMAPLVGGPVTVTLTLPKAEPLQTIELKFDSNLSRQICISMSQQVRDEEAYSVPPELVKDYRLVFLRKGKIAAQRWIAGNSQRFNRIVLEQPVICDAVRLEILATNGDEKARVFEIRLYA